MLTFLIDMHGGLADLEMAAPFLYPLAHRLKLVKLPTRSAQGFGAAADEICSLLEQGIPGHWQAIFLVDLAAGFGHPFSDSLTSLFWTIEERLLKPLGQRQYCPRNVFVLTVDTLPRAPGGRPLDPARVGGWELDVRGWVDALEGEEYLLGRSDIEALDAAWGEKLVIRGEKFDRGFAALSPELQAEIKGRWEQLQAAAAALFERKRKKLRAAADQEDFLKGRLQTCLDNIEADFRAQVGGILLEPKSAELLSNFFPSHWLKGAIRHHLGLHADALKEAFYLLRYVFPEGQQREYHKKIVELSFLLIAAVENDLGSRLHRFTPHEIEVAWVEEDLARLPRLLADYRRSLGAHEEELRQEMDNRSAKSLELSNFLTRKCSEDLSDPAIGDVRFGFFQEHDDIIAWNEWARGVKEAVDRAEEELHCKIGACVEQATGTRLDVEEVEIQDLEQEAAELEKLYLRKRRELPGQEVGLPDKAEFAALIRRKSREMDMELQRRPPRNQFRLVSLVGFLLLYLSILFQLHRLESYAVWAGVALFAILIVGRLCRLEISWRLKRIKGEVANRARGLILKMRDEFERQKENVLRLFNVNVARENYMRARNELQQERDDKLLLQFHLNQLQIHRLKGEKLSALFPPAGSDISRLSRKDFEDLAVQRPVFQNPVYAPAQFGRLPTALGYRIDVDGGESEHTSRLVFDIEKIVFKKDGAYGD